MTISLPPALLQRFEEVRKAESRTRSELVREALRAYFEGRYPAVRATKAEIAALRRGRLAFRQGETLSLGQFLNDLEPATNRSRAKRLSKAAPKRPASS